LPGKISFHFLPPVKIEAGDSAEILKNKLFKLMWDYYTTAAH
jgi:hypothetical protein